MNKVIISGNLTKDMDVMVTKNDVNIGKFTVAVNNGYGENTNTQFYPVRLFQKSNGLIADGIVGKNTWRKILNI